RSQADIVSLLATGQLADQAGGIGGGGATQQAIALLSGEALGFAAQAIGVDSIRLERDPALDAFAANPAIAAEVNPAQRLTISRRITNVEVTLSQNLSDQGRFTWIFAYSPTRPVELRVLSRDDRSRSYELRHDLSFGGVARPAPSRDEGARAASRVSGVQVTGDLRYPAAEVQGTLDLRAGDRFDFYRWQEDRDRLRRFYLDRHHLEVRISARRVESAEGDRVALEYDVQAGPIAHLEITGHSVSGAVIKELERIWSNTIIQVALLNDLRAAMRQHMTEDGYLRAEVDVSQVPSEDGHRRIRVAVTPGSRVSSRRVEFAGNDHLSTDVLQAASVRLGGTVWLTPSDLAEEVARLYLAEGYLAAKVTAGPVTITGTEAVLPVRIEEGAAFHVGRVVVSGAKARSETQVRADLNLEQGAPYTPAAVQQSQTAVNRAYDKNGFTAMTSAVETVADTANATVELRITIDEGPQQVLDAVRVTGADDVRPGVVADALRLSTGAPVDMDAWYAGRRRLFRTGLFQRVDVEPTPVDEPGPPGIRPVRATVTLVRRSPYRLRYGVDVTDQDDPLAEQGRMFGAGMSANLERYGLFGRPGTVGTSVRVNTDQRIGRGFLTLPSFLGREVTSRLYASRSREFVEGEGILSIVVDTSAFTAEQRFRVRSNVEVGYGYQFERNHTFDTNADPDDPFKLDNVVKAARLTATMVFDTRTDPFA
ncbi:MAG TPA: POTRA domain-containing protein, partial [Vicinamibacterales bacterium]